MFRGQPRKRLLGRDENWFARQIARTEGAIGISAEMPAIEILTSLALLRMTKPAVIPSTIPKPPLCKGRWRGQAATEGLSHAHFSRYEYLPYALFSFVGPLRGAVLLARPKVPKNRTGVPPAPRRPEPNAATLDCPLTEHCSVPWRTAKRGGPQAPSLCHPERPHPVILSKAKDLPRPSEILRPVASE